VPKTPYQRRIRRAEHLAREYPFAAEILGFYVRIAGFQEEMYRRLDGRDGVPLAPQRAGRPLDSRPEAGATPVNDATLLADFPKFLALVEKHGPNQLVQVARELRAESPDAHGELFNAIWSSGGESPSSPEEFLALAYLQPQAEFQRSRANLQFAGYTGSFCPFCNRRAALAVLRPLGDGGQRNLLCGFCLTEWEFRRIICPGCGEENHARLPVYTAETFPHIRVECCDSCQSYIKSIDLTKNGLAEPLVDELAAIPLDLWAQERGYSKLHPNLLGM